MTAEGASAEPSDIAGNWNHPRVAYGLYCATSSLCKSEQPMYAFLYKVCGCSQKYSFIYYLGKTQIHMSCKWDINLTANVCISVPVYGM